MRNGIITHYSKHRPNEVGTGKERKETREGGLGQKAWSGMGEGTEAGWIDGSPCKTKLFDCAWSRVTNC